MALQPVWNISSKKSRGCRLVSLLQWINIWRSVFFQCSVDNIALNKLKSNLVCYNSYSERTYQSWFKKHRLEILKPNMATGAVGQMWLMRMKLNPFLNLTFLYEKFQTSWRCTSLELQNVCYTTIPTESDPGPNTMNVLKLHQSLNFTKKDYDFPLVRFYGSHLFVTQMLVTEPWWPN